MAKLNHPRLFGTDGVRGVGGPAAARSADRPPARRGAGARAAARHRRRRSSSSAATRASRAAWIEAELAHGACGEGAVGDQRRRRADAGRRLPDAHRQLRRRRRHLRVAQSVRGQRHQGVLRHAARSSPRRSSAKSKRSSPTASWSAHDRRGRRRCRAPIWSTPTSITCARCFPEAPTVERFPIVIDCANGATTTGGAGAVQQPRLRDDRHRQPARRPQHQPRLRLDASRAAGARRVVDARLRDGRGVRRRRRSRDLRRSPRPDRRRRRGAADVRPPAAARRPAEGRRHRRDRDEQHRPRDRAAASSASSWCAARSATST